MFHGIAGEGMRTPDDVGLFDYRAFEPNGPNGAPQTRNWRRTLS